jgi:cytoskeletal protein CcmA (bactofilin family)
MLNSISYSGLLFVLLCTVVLPSPAQETGETVRLRDTYHEDVYAAGGTVEIMASVEGDVLAAGGQVTVGDHITGDVMAAGGIVSVDAAVTDDVRLAGGDVRIGGSVGDDAIAAGGRITLAGDSRVNGRAWFSGGHVEVAGTVGKELRVAGERIVLSGRVHGDVMLTGGRISIQDGAVIEGDLVYRSPREAEISGGAQIGGEVRYEPIEHPIREIIAAIAGVGIVVLLSLIVTGSALYLLFPRFMESAITTVRTEPWKCLGLGLAVFAATPVVTSTLLFTVVGWLPALILGAVYLILLLAGFLTGAFTVAELGRGALKRGAASRAGRLWSLAVALLVIMLLGLVPLFGTLLLLVVMLLGTGSLILGVYRSYVAEKGS